MVQPFGLGADFVGLEPEAEAARGGESGDLGQI